MHCICENEWRNTRSPSVLPFNSKCIIPRSSLFDVFMCPVVQRVEYKYCRWYGTRCIVLAQMNEVTLGFRQFYPLPGTSHTLINLAHCIYVPYDSKGWMCVLKGIRNLIRCTSTDEWSNTRLSSILPFDLIGNISHFNRVNSTQLCVLWTKWLNRNIKPDEKPDW